MYQKELGDYLAKCNAERRLANIRGLIIKPTASTISHLVTIARGLSFDEFAREVDDIRHAVKAFDYSAELAIAELAESVEFGFELIDEADGSVSAIPATPARVTDTELVTVTRADGTTSTFRQTASQAGSVIEKGHATLASKVESGDITEFVEDLD